MSWPQKRRLLGVDVSVTDYAQAVGAITEAARCGAGGAVAALSIHSIVFATVRPEFGDQVNALDLATPDGQGSRWALNWLHHTGLRDRVYGPRLTLEIADQAARDGLPVYLYGSTPKVLNRLQQRLEERFPGLLIAGVHSPPFRTLTPREEAADLAVIRRSGARIVFVGLGCPRQETWVCRHRRDTDAVLVAVGAAFDFISGNKRQAPGWIQRCGLEMVFRLCMEPRRLWRRFLCFSPPFVLLVLLQKLAWARFPAPGRIRVFGFRVLDQSDATHSAACSPMQPAPRR